MTLKMLLRSSATISICFLMTSVSSAAGWLKTGGAASRPFGHVAYCATSKSDCTKRSVSAKLPAVQLSKLQKVNTAINRAIKPVSDQDQYGTREKWVKATRSGDCEDYALAKRARLSSMGISRSNLLLAVGSYLGQPHTVLVVRTRDGDYVLNNMNDEVVAIGSSRLGIHKIQSPTNAAEWLKVTGTIRAPA